MEDFSFRLIKNIYPLSYEIFIEPVAPDYKVFNGKCSINFQTSDIKQNFIVLHAHDIVIKKVILINGDTQLYSAGVKHHDEFQQVKIMFPSGIPLSGKLVIDYSGKIQTDPIGFCKINDEQDFVMYTQFEPICARKCFPCFDEPSFRAKFSLEIVSPMNKFVLSNTQVKSITQINSGLVYTFEETPPMSTYLVAFYIGNATYVEIKTKDGTIVNIYGKKRPQYLEYVALIVKKGLEYMNNYFGFKYILPKLDLVFVPALEGTAMENWGLITYKDGTSSSEMDIMDKIELVYVINHELAHHWFGNLVTIDWWSEIFIKESMASWLGWAFTILVMQDLNIKEYYFLFEMITAFREDSLHCTRPIKKDINNSEDINNMFDVISYSKGTTVVDMIARYMGQKKFQSAIRHYINEYKFKAATFDNFIDCLEQEAGNEVKQMANEWVHNKNYPIVKITCSNDSIKIKQHAFTILPNNFDTIWTIPLTKEILLNGKEIIVRNKDIFKINLDSLGFYVVRYDDIVLKKILSDEFEKLSHLDLASILLNNFLFLKANKMSFDSYLWCHDIIITKLSKQKPSIFLLKIIAKNFFVFKRIIKNEYIVNRYKNVLEKYIEDLFTIYYRHTPMVKNEESDTIKIITIDLLFAFKTEYIINYFNRIFNTFMEEYQKDNSVMLDDNSEIMEIIFESALIYQPKDKRDIAYNFLYNLLKNEKYSDTIIKVISLTPDLDNYKKSLDLIFSDDVDIENKFILLNFAAHNIYHNNYLWEFIKQNWDRIYEQFDHLQISTKDLITPLSHLVDTDGTMVEDMTDFFSKKNIKKVEFVINKTLEKIIINTELNRRFNAVLPRLISIRHA